MSNLLEHARKELELAGHFKKDSLYGGMLGEAVMELMEVFVKQGHSGMSASYTVALFKQLASFKPIAPITGEEDEWEDTGTGFYQNIRCSALFKEGKDGKPYYLDAIVWDEDGHTFTGTVEGISSKQYVKLPFTPKTFYVKIDRDRKIIDKHTLKKAFEYYENYSKT